MSGILLPTLFVLEIKLDNYCLSFFKERNPNIYSDSFLNPIRRKNSLYSINIKRNIVKKLLLDYKSKWFIPNPILSHMSGQ